MGIAGLMDGLRTLGVRLALSYLDRNPDKNIPRILDLLIKCGDNEHVAPKARAVRAMLDDPNNNWYRLIRSLWTDIDTGVRRTLFTNAVINAAVVGLRRQASARTKYGCNVPWAILMDPTSACNLRCVGCWAADYGTKLNMSLDTLESIITQGKELGIYFYIYSGGEPLVRKRDIIRLCEAHPDCVFLAFTNGTLIDDEFANEMLRVKNFVPAISIEGYEGETDSRRGAGTYQAVINAMQLLRDRKLPFGVSCCYTSRNTEVIGSEKFVDDVIARGAKFAWFFTYMPVGVNAAPELIARPDQREYMYRQIRAFRQTKPIFTMDFWNDGEYSGGCIAGGRRYLHINANGDVEPCAFIHYSDSSIYDKTLLEALKSPLFMEYHRQQPFNCNHLRPCPLLDNPGILAEMVETAGAMSTDLENPENVRDLTAKCTPAAERWAPVAQRLWDAAHLRNGAATTDDEPPARAS
jgi:MoaA/NifB/PqqE/SkfB family radical SAM enzyme